MLTRQQKIEKLIEYSKSILPKIEAQITKEMQEEIDNDPYTKHLKEKPQIDQNKLKTRTKEQLIEDLKKYALKEFAPNRKTLSEYLEVVLLKLGYE